MLFCVRVCYHYRLNGLGVFSSVLLECIENDSWKTFIYSDTSFLCWVAAKVALVKCRDLHWAMMAHRDQRDVSLSSLRMLIVTDGANPCEYAHTAVLQRDFSASYYHVLKSNCFCRRHALGC